MHKKSNTANTLVYNFVCCNIATTRSIPVMCIKNIYINFKMLKKVKDRFNGVINRSPKRLLMALYKQIQTLTVPWSIILKHFSSVTKNDTEVIKC